MQKEKTTTQGKKKFLQKSGKNMFAWVTIASIMCSVSIVFSVILFQRIFFINKVIDEKNKTLNTLASNNHAIPSLEDAVRALNSNQDLISAKARQTDDAVQVVLDALPTDSNYPALGASFQQVLLNNKPDIEVLSLSVNQSNAAASLVESKKIPGVYEMSFDFSVQGSPESILDFLKYLEKSIRAIDTKKMTIYARLITTKDEKGNPVQKQANVLSISGVTYYQPVKEIKVETKEIKQ